MADEKETNYALQAQSRETFIKAVTDGLSAPPQYFSINARINKEGYESIDEVLQAALQPLKVSRFRQLMQEEGVTVLDTREAMLFTEGFVPGSINIGLNGRFAEWAGSLLSFDKPILLVTETGKEKESVVRLARVGFDKMIGYLEGGFASWKKAGEATDMIVNVEADELAMDLSFDPKIMVLDVRRETEFADGHIRGAVNTPVNELLDPASMAGIEDSLNVYLHCAGGYRSIIAASLLKRQGIHNIRNVTGGWSAIKERGGIEIVKENSVLN